MNIDAFNIAYNKLIDEINESYISSESDSEPITDGIADTQIYFNSKYRILWILKEAYDGENCTGGGWDLPKDLFLQNNLYEKIKNIPALQVITYVSYGLLNGFLLWKDMDFLRDDPDMVSVLKQIAYINISKLPGHTISDNSKIREIYSKHKTLLLRQIELLSPNIIIGGSTLDLFIDDLNIDRNKLNSENTFRYYLSDGKIFIFALHPSQWTQITRAEYVNTIIKIVQSNNQSISSMASI